MDPGAGQRAEGIIGWEGSDRGSPSPHNSPPQKDQENTRGVKAAPARPTRDRLNTSSARSVSPPLVPTKDENDDAAVIKNNKKRFIPRMTGLESQSKTPPAPGNTPRFADHKPIYRFGSHSPVKKEESLRRLKEVAPVVPFRTRRMSERVAEPRVSRGSMSIGADSDVQKVAEATYPMPIRQPNTTLASRGAHVNVDVGRVLDVNTRDMNRFEYESKNVVERDEQVEAQNGLLRNVADALRFQGDFKSLKMEGVKSKASPRQVTPRTTTRTSPGRLNGKTSDYVGYNRANASRQGQERRLHPLLNQETWFNSAEAGYIFDPESMDLEEFFGLMGSQEDAVRQISFDVANALDTASRAAESSSPVPMPGSVSPSRPGVPTGYTDDSNVMKHRIILDEKVAELNTLKSTYDIVRTVLPSGAYASDSIHYLHPISTAIRKKKIDVENAKFQLQSILSKIRTHSVRHNPGSDIDNPKHMPEKFLDRVTKEVHEELQDLKRFKSAQLPKAERTRAEAVAEELHEINQIQRKILTGRHAFSKARPLLVEHGWEPEDRLVFKVQATSLDARNPNLQQRSDSKSRGAARRQVSDKQMAQNRIKSNGESGLRRDSSLSAVSPGLMVQFEGEADMRPPTSQSTVEILRGILREAIHSPESSERPHTHRGTSTQASPAGTPAARSRPNTGYSRTRPVAEPNASEVAHRISGMSDRISGMSDRQIRAADRVSYAHKLSNKQRSPMMFQLDGRKAQIQRGVPSAKPKRAALVRASSPAQRTPGVQLPLSPRDSRMTPRMTARSSSMASDTEGVREAKEILKQLKGSLVQMDPPLDYIGVDRDLERVTRTAPPMSLGRSKKQ